MRTSKHCRLRELNSVALYLVRQTRSEARKTSCYFEFNLHAYTVNTSSLFYVGGIHCEWKKITTLILTAEAALQEQILCEMSGNFIFC